jgi:hypothetical protein
MINAETIANLRRLSRDRGATKAERSAAKTKADELEFPGRELSDADLEIKIASARREAEAADAKVKEAEKKIKEAASEKTKLLGIHTTTTNEPAKFTAELQLRQELKLRKLSDAEIGTILVNGTET